MLYRHAGEEGVGGGGVCVVEARVEEEVRAALRGIQHIQGGGEKRRRRAQLCRAEIQWRDGKAKPSTPQAKHPSDATSAAYDAAYASYASDARGAGASAANYHYQDTSGPAIRDAAGGELSLLRHPRGDT